MDTELVASLTVACQSLIGAVAAPFACVAVAGFIAWMFRTARF